MDACAICFEPLSEGSTLPCHHRFHSICVEPWLLKKGTCPTCRYRVSEVDSDEDGDEDYDIERIREAVLEFWQRRQAIGFHVFQHIEFESEFGPEPEPHYEAIVENIVETEMAWTYTVRGEAGQSLKTDAESVKNGTEASLPTCLYALHIHANDVINAILYIG